MVSGELVQPEGSKPDRRRLVLVAVAGAIALADQVSKTVALRTLDEGPVHLLGDGIQFRLAKNSGGAFSLLSGLTPLITFLAVGAVIVITRIGSRSDDRSTTAAWSMILGGAVGNLVDRMARSPGFPTGEVVDFVKVGWWPTFNLADSAITLGAVLLVIRTWRN